MSKIVSQKICHRELVFWMGRKISASFVVAREFSIQQPGAVYLVQWGQTLYKIAYYCHLSTQICVWVIFRQVSWVCIVGINSPSHFEAHKGLFRLLLKGSFDPNVCTLTFWKKILISNALLGIFSDIVKSGFKHLDFALKSLFWQSVQLKQKKLKGLEKRTIWGFFYKLSFNLKPEAD